MKDKIKGLLSTYKNMPAPALAAFWYMVCSVMQRGISLLVTPIFTRIMTTEEYGVYSVYQSWYQIVIIFATLNLFYTVYNKGLTEWPEDRARFTSSMQGLTTTITLALFLVFSIRPSFWSNLMGLEPLYIYAMFVEILCVPAYSFWSAGQRYDYKYKQLIGVTLFIVIMTPALGVVCVLNARNKAAARVLSAVFVQVCVGLFFYIYNMVKGKCFFNKKYWLFALAFNIPLIPHYLSSTILGQSDRLMINAMVGSSEAAIYSVSYSVATIASVVTTAITNTFTPYMFKEIKQGRVSGIRKNANYLLIIVGLVATVMMAFGPEIVRIFAAPEYYDAIWVIPPVASGIFFTFLYPLFSNFEFYYEKNTFIMVASCFGAVLNIILNYLLIPVFGYYVAGYTTLVCDIVYSFAHYFCYRKIISDNGLEDAFDMRLICALSMAMLIVMVCMTVLYNYTLIRYAVCCILCVGIFLKRNTIISKFKELRASK